MKKSNNVAAKLLEKVARTSVKMQADSRCMFMIHQPKMPEGIRKFCK
ncbi:MAG: cyclic lactone autoinducer peptide [Pseudobutyrivibrio sp.]|nr:cyclic lactone autoinducer peptide [Pseudobutyrivibrio sp.]